MGHNSSRAGFTLIELVMAMAITAILSVTGGYLMVSLVGNCVFIPNALNVGMIGRDLLDTMIEGNSQAKGLRFSTVISAGGNTTVTFKNTDGQNVQFIWDSTKQKILESINGGNQAVIPYYVPAGIAVGARNSNPIFTYYDSNEAPTTNPSLVRRVKIDFSVKSGSGNYQDWQSFTECTSSIAVKKFQ